MRLLSPPRRRRRSRRQSERGCSPVCRRLLLAACAVRLLFCGAVLWLGVRRQQSGGVLRCGVLLRLNKTRNLVPFRLRGKSQNLCFVQSPQFGFFRNLAWVVACFAARLRPSPAAVCFRRSVRRGRLRQGGWCVPALSVVRRCPLVPVLVVGGAASLAFAAQSGRFDD